MSRKSWDEVIPPPPSIGGPGCHDGKVTLQGLDPDIDPYSLMNRLKLRKPLHFKTEPLDVKTEPLDFKTEPMHFKTEPTSTSDSIPSTSDSIPSTSDSIPSTFGSIPSTSGSMPSTSGSNPATSDSIHSISCSIPSTSQSSKMNKQLAVRRLPNPYLPDNLRRDDDDVIVDYVGVRTSRQKKVDELMATRTYYDIAFSVLRNSVPDENWRSKNYNLNDLRTAQLLCNGINSDNRFRELALGVLQEAHLGTHDQSLVRLCQTIPDINTEDSQRLFFSPVSIEKDLYMSRIESCGDFKKARRSRLYFYLYGLFSRFFNPDFWIAHRYIYYVWMPEIVLRDIIEREGVSREAAETFLLPKVLALLIKDFPENTPRYLPEPVRCRKRPMIKNKVATKKKRNKVQQRDAVQQLDQNTPHCVEQALVKLEEIVPETQKSANAVEQETGVVKSESLNCGQKLENVKRIEQDQQIKQVTIPKKEIFITNQLKYTNTGSKKNKYEDDSCQDEWIEHVESDGPVVDVKKDNQMKSNNNKVCKQTDNLKKNKYSEQSEQSKLLQPALQLQETSRKELAMHTERHGRMGVTIPNKEIHIPNQLDYLNPWSKKIKEEVSDQESDQDEWIELAESDRPVEEKKKDSQLKSNSKELSIENYNSQTMKYIDKIKDPVLRQQALKLKETRRKEFEISVKRREQMRLIKEMGRNLFPDETKQQQPFEELKPFKGLKSSNRLSLFRERKPTLPNRVRHNGQETNAGVSAKQNEGTIDDISANGDQCIKDIEILDKQPNYLKQIQEVEGLENVSTPAEQNEKHTVLVEQSEEGVTVQSKKKNVHYLERIDDTKKNVPVIHFVPGKLAKPFPVTKLLKNIAQGNSPENQIEQISNIQENKRPYVVDVPPKPVEVFQCTDWARQMKHTMSLGTRIKQVEQCQRIQNPKHFKDVAISTEATRWYMPYRGLPVEIKPNPNKRQSEIREAQDRYNRVSARKPIEIVKKDYVYPMKRSLSFERVDDFSNDVQKSGDCPNQAKRVKQDTMRLSQDPMRLSQDWNPMRQSQHTMRLSQDPMRLSQDPMRLSQDTMRRNQETMSPNEEETSNQSQELEQSKEKNDDCLSENKVKQPSSWAQRVHRVIKLMQENADTDCDEDIKQEEIEALMNISNDDDPTFVGNLIERVQQVGPFYICPNRSTHPTYREIWEAGLLVFLQRHRFRKAQSHTPTQKSTLLRSDAGFPGVKPSNNLNNEDLHIIEQGNPLEKLD